MDKYLLKILSVFKPLFKMARVDYDQLEAIVAIKLVMDNRRQLIAYRKKEGKESSSSFLQTLFFYGLFGGFIALALYGIPSFMFSMIIFFSYIMVMIAMTLITDFSSILLDTSDNTIILPRPVDSRTVFFARLSHILLYLGQLTFSLSLIPLIVVAIKYNLILMLAFLVCIALSVIVAVFLTNAVYLLIMQFSSEEKLKNIINYFQIIMAIFVVGGYQILPRMMGFLDLKNFSFNIQWWNFLIPPVWMAGALETIYLRTTEPLHLALTACALFLPVVIAWSVNRYLTPIFNRKLGSMGASTEAPVAKNTQEKESNVSKVGKLVTSGSFENGAFDLVYKILGRDRKLKLKIYPAFGYVFIFAMIFMIRGKEDLLTTWQNLPQSNYHIVVIYLTFMVVQVAVHEIPYSDEFKASWIYFSSPLDKPGEIISGSMKAIFVRLFLPIYGVICVIVLIIWKWQAVDDILFGLVNNFLMLLIIVALSKKQLPLSIAASLKNQAGNFARGIMIVLLIGALGLGHYLLTLMPYLLLAAVPVQLVLIYFIHKSIRETPWAQITL